MKVVIISLLVALGGAALPAFGQASASAGSADAPNASTGSYAASGEGAGDGRGLQEVIVTAQKYRQAAFDVPISMTVIGGAQLQALGVTNFEDLQFFVPGMYVNNIGVGLIVTIRGISNQFGQGALVGTYLDEADLTGEAYEGIDLDTYDLSRVEVLKGPQGTLYGDGSEGGTIRYITNKPVLNEVQMGANVTGLFDEYGAPETRVEAVVNVPVVADKLGLRVAAEIDDGGGWIDQPAADKRNINGKDLADVRIEGRWKPRDDLAVDAMYVIHRDSSGGSDGENPVGTYTQVFNLTTTPTVENNYDVTNLTVNWDPGVVSVVNSATYYRHYFNEANMGAYFPFTAPPLPPLEEYWTSFPTKDYSVSDELRVSNDGAGPWRWTWGGFLRRVDNSLPYSSASFGSPGPSGSPLPAPFSDWQDIYSNAKSAFGDTNYRLFGKLVVGAGVRYFRDGESAFLLGDTQHEKATFNSVDPRFYIRYGISQNVNIYASAAKGFRSGGFNGLGFPQFQPEHVWTYEFGTKTRLLHDYMIVDSDVFLSNYGGYQIIGIVPPPAPPLDITRNAGNARIKGIESDVTLIPAERWRLSVNGDYINARFVSVSVNDSAYDVGDPVDFVPRYQVTAAAEREFDAGDRPGFVRVDYTQRARATFRQRNTGPGLYDQSDYMYLLGFRAGVHWSENVEVGSFVQNILNDRGYVGSEALFGRAARQQPRTFGVYFKVKAD